MLVGSERGRKRKIRRGRGGGDEEETRVAYQNAKVAPRLIHFKECLARRAWVGLVAHVTHVGYAAEIPRSALAVHFHKSTCRR